jgi:transcriptional regulator GlxA family with amidase domain
MAPPRRERPVVAVLGHNDGTETTDYLIPYAVLAESDAAEVVAIAPEQRPIRLTPALSVAPQATLAGFDKRWPAGADYVIVAAMHPRDDPAILAWIRTQAARGATIVGVCSGVRTLAAAGLLEGRTATRYWYDDADVRELSPGTRWVTDRRYVIDGGIVTTTGITASLPVSLALVEAIAGRERAAEVAATFGVDAWDARHDSTRFAFDRSLVGTALANKARLWGHETVGVPVQPGVDEVAVAFRADAWARTFRSRAVAVATRPGPVRMRHGLVLLPERSNADGIDLGLPSRDARVAAQALPESLAAIRERYGDETARFVATQLEFAWSPGRDGKGSRPAP